MTKRYSKHYSNFILRKKYQYSTKGTIWERDWVTIGAQHQIEKGKRPFYGDSGFLFTDNSIPDTHKRHDFGKIVGEWTYDDVYSSTPLVNEVKLNYNSNDLRDFAYYGSCSELIRTSIENILTWFPGCMIKDEKCYKVTKLDDKNYKFELQQDCNGSNIEYMFSNPFQFDLITENINNREIKNIRRYVSKTWADFDIILGDNYKTPLHVINYSVKKEGTIDTCLSIQKIAKITITYIDGDNEKELTINAYLCNGDVVYTTKDKDVSEIRLSEGIIEQYFYNVEGFERLLLRRDTKPLYSNTFLKLFETDNGIRYAYRDYAWPTVNDYCIDIESPVYAAFVQSLNETATEFDNVWTDNMWRNMTHEAIKNYDWTYTKEYAADDEQDFIDGGSRMEKLIRVYGRVFDDIKRYIDGIRFTSKISYDEYNNMPDAEISDKLEYNGWEIYSTIPYFQVEGENGKVIGDDLSTVYLSDDALDRFSIKWFLSKNNNEVTAAASDISFLRRLALSSKYLIKSKGTLKGIDMIMALFGLGPSDYSIEEQYYTVQMKNYSEDFEKNIADLVHYDNVSWFYDDPYEGVPFGNVELYNQKYIIPYYDHSKKYLGDLAFQSSGGWAKKSLDTDERNDYEETLSYLNVVPNFSALLNVSTYALDDADENIYYVADISDYYQFNNMPVEHMSHYFLCEDIYNPEMPTSWKNIEHDYIETISIEEYNELNEEEKSLYYQCKGGESYCRYHEGGDQFERAKYLDGIISSSAGNNPHVGYGRYDLGSEYMQYMQRPFKYFTDNYNLPDAISNKINDEENSFRIGEYPYAAIRWGEITSKVRMPYLTNTGWDEVIDTENETYYYRKTNDKTVYDAKVKDISNTYRYSDGYYKQIGLDEWRVDLTIPYTEEMTYDGHYVYDKILSQFDFSSLPEDQKTLWKESVVNGVTYYSMKEPLRKNARRSDLLVPWSGSDIAIDGKFIYIKQLSDEQYNEMCSDIEVSDDERDGWETAIIRINVRTKYTDTDDGILNTVLERNYYLNTKMFIMRLSHNNEYFKRYFLDVIGKYVVQMIPSTAITVFLFEDDNNENSGN